MCCEYFNKSWVHALLPSLQMVVMLSISLLSRPELRDNPRPQVHLISSPLHPQTIIIIKTLSHDALSSLKLLSQWLARRSLAAALHCAMLLPSPFSHIRTHSLPQCPSYHGQTVVRYEILFPTSESGIETCGNELRSAAFQRAISWHHTFPSSS